MKKITLIILGLILGAGFTVKAASVIFPYQGGTGTGSVPTYGQLLVGNAGGTYTLTATSSLGITGTGGGTGTVSTSSVPTVGNLSYWTSNGYPSLLGSVATSSVTINTPLTSAGTAGYVVGGSGWTLDVATTTNSLFTGTAGQVLGYTANGWTGVATTTFSGGLLYTNGDVTDVLTAGDGLTRTVNDFDCDTASGSVFGCLTSADWTTFNNKQATISATYPITLTGAAVGLAFGTTTSNTWAGTQTFTNAPILSSLTGILKGNGSSALTAAANGTDYTLLTSTTCSGTDKISAVTASGGVTCSTDTGGAAVGTVSTSTTPVIGNLAYWTGTGYPSTLGTVATSTLSATSPLTGSFTQIGSGGSLGCQTASGSQAGCLASADWTTFNNKQGTISATWPITLSGAAVGFNGLSTSTAAVLGNIPYFSGVNIFANVATSSLAVGSGLTVSSGSLGSQIGGSAATIKQIENRSFSYATSSAWTGTTTIPLGVGYGEVWNNIQCFTDAGTLNVDFYYNTTHMTNPVSFNASTTIGKISAFSNTTPSAASTVKVDIGTPATSPTKVSCTINDTN